MQLGRWRPGAAKPRPRILISASAVGYYGARGDEALDETSAPGAGFLTEVCRPWEDEASRAEAVGMRVVRLRLGMVLAGDGGALGRMLPPFRAFVGGRLGDGEQWVSWIHRGDVTGLVVDALANDGYQGAVNATAPQPVRNRDFVAALGRVLARPAAIPVPAVVLRLALGEMADVLLTGQRVLPRAAEPGRMIDVTATPRALRSAAYGHAGKAGGAGGNCVMNVLSCQQSPVPPAGR